MTIKETISSLKISLSERAYFTGRRQPKITQDLETQPPEIVSEDEMGHKRRVIFYFSFAAILFVLALFFVLCLVGVIPEIPHAAAQKIADDAAAQKIAESERIETLASSPFCFRVMFRGLEVWDEEAHEYYLAPPVESAYVVNPGNLFERWSNDVYVSNVHPVINCSGMDRYSIPSKYDGNPDFIISCITLCRNKPDDEKHAPISVDDVRQNYKDVHSRVGIYNVAERVA